MYFQTCKSLLMFPYDKVDLTHLVVFLPVLPRRGDTLALQPDDSEENEVLRDKLIKQKYQQMSIRSSRNEVGSC